MTAAQIYSFINEVQQDALGANAIRVKDTSSLVSLGDIVLSSQTNTEQFYQKLADRIGQTIIKGLVYVAPSRRYMLMDPMTFGVVLQKVQVRHMAGATENGAWPNASSNAKNPFDQTQDTTDIIASLYSSYTTWAADTKTIYDYQLSSAFTDAAKMGAFVDLIFTDMNNALEYQIEQVCKLARATAIATCLEGTNANVKRNLLSEYNTAKGGTAISVTAALMDTNFLKFASRQILLATKRMQNMTRLFNNATADKFTKPENLVVEVLADFSTATDAYLEADTYHNELVRLPAYHEIDSWQAIGTDYGFGSTSKVNIITEDAKKAVEGTNDDPEAVEQAGIIAFIRDKDKVGCTVDKVRTKSMYNPAAESTNYFKKADIGFYSDKAEQGVVFYIA